MSYFENGSINLKLVFSQPIFEVETKVIDYDKLKELIKEKRKIDDGEFKSNYGGWHSSDLLKDDNFKPFIETLWEEIFNSLYPSVIRGGYRFIITNAWININSKNNYNVTHVHSECDMSGVLYVDANKSSSINFENQSLVFSQTRLDDRVTEKFKENHGFCSNIAYSPKDGIMLLFPSYLHHSVYPNLSDTERISISFNIRFDK
tara:strand:+ start:146 stop:757 length:612 start_codon:yes stop_codon:yes gene_type:complete